MTDHSSRAGAAQALPDQLELAQFLCSEVAAEPWDELSKPKYMADADVILAFLSSVSSTPQAPNREVAEQLIQRHANAYVARGGAISDDITAECRTARDALLAALCPVSSTGGQD